MTVVGQCLGSGTRKDEAVYYIKKLSVLAEIIVVASCLLVFALTIPVTKLGGMESESARMCFHMISWITVVKPIAMDPGVYSCLWPQSSRRCKIFNAYILYHYVDIPFLSLCISDPFQRLRPNGCMDWNVY